ncbi:MAG: hypothetical protein WDN31_06055 [Hyphomicrobium sp.]
MIRLIVTGIWISLVTALSSYAATLWYASSSPEAEGKKLFSGLESMQTSMVSVPVVSNGAVQGYVLAQFTFTMKSEALGKMSVKPEVFLVDAAFRSIYSGEAAALRGAKKQDLEALTATIKRRVNERFGAALVEDVLIESLTFVPKDEVRDGANLVKKRPPDFTR